MANSSCVPADQLAFFFFNKHGRTTVVTVPSPPRSLRSRGIQARPITVHNVGELAHLNFYFGVYLFCVCVLVQCGEWLVVLLFPRGSFKVIRVAHCPRATLPASHGAMSPLLCTGRGTRIECELGSVSKDLP